MTGEKWHSVAQKASKEIIHEETDSEIIMAPEPGEGRAKMSMGQTINLGDFNSARIEVGAEIPCQPTKEGISAAHQFLLATLRETITPLVKKAKERAYGV